MDSKGTPRESAQLNTFNITQTLKPFYHSHSIHKQYFMIIPMYKKMLDHLFVTSATIATELTQAGNIHFHAQMTTILSEDEFILTYNILTKSLGFSKIVLVKSQQSQETYAQYMVKDLKQTQRMFNAYMDFSRKDLPKNFKEFDIKHFFITIKKPIEILFSHYNNIQCPTSATLPAQQPAGLDEYLVTQSDVLQ